MSKLKVSVSGRICGNLSVCAVRSEDDKFTPITILDVGTSNFKKRFEVIIPDECKYKTILIHHNWVGRPKAVGGQIDVYTGGNIEFEAPLTAFIGSTGASSAKLIYNGTTNSCKAGGRIRFTEKEE